MLGSMTGGQQRSPSVKRVIFTLTFNSQKQRMHILNTHTVTVCVGLELVQP